MRFDENGADYQGVAVTAEAYRENGFYYCIPFIKNNGSENSGQITLMRSLDILLPETHLQYESINGDSADGASFFPVYRELNTGDSISVCAHTGRPSEGIFPVFVLRYGTVKQLFAIGWAGRWSYEIHVTEKGTRITAGIPQADFYLKPGEEVRMPSVICITGTGEEVYARFRSFLKKKTDSFMRGRCLPIAASPFDRYFWENPRHECFSRKGQMRVADAMKEIGSFDTLWLDAAWFRDAETFPLGVGNYSVRDVFDYTLKPVSDYAHKSGFRFLVWFEPERVCRGTEMYASHTEYMLKGESGDSFLYDLSAPGAAEYLASALLDAMDKNGIDILRIDYNIIPIAYWQQHDEPGRRGITELGCVAGWYRLLDRLHAARPDLIIDNCASGGRRLEPETLMRTVSLWRSDMGCHPDTPTNRVTVWKQNCTLSLSRYLPYHCSGSWDACGYECRCGCTSGACCQFDYWGKEYDPDITKKAVAEIKHLRNYWLGDFYPLTEITTDETVWAGYRLAKNGNGVFYLFRREQALNDSMIINVPEAAEGKYCIRVSDEFYNTCEFTVEGAVLRTGISIKIPHKRQSAVVEYIAL